MKYSFYKNIVEKNGTFHMQIVFKGGTKHARIICDTCSKLSIWAQKQHHIFSFWTTFNNSRGALIANVWQIYSFRSFVFFNTSFLSLQLEGEETLKYRFVCRTFAKKFNIVSNDHGHMQYAIFPFSTGNSLFARSWSKKKKKNQNGQFKIKFGT